MDEKYGVLFFKKFDLYVYVNTKSRCYKKRSMMERNKDCDCNSIHLFTQIIWSYI